MDVAEIQRSYCVCAQAKGAVVGVSCIRLAHPFSRPRSRNPLSAWVANLPRGPTATELFQRRGISCMVSVRSPADSVWELGCVCLPQPPSRGGHGGFESCRRMCSDEAVSHQRSGTDLGPNAFLFTSVQLPWIYLSLLHIPAGWLLDSQLPNLSVFSSLDCWASSFFVSRAYLLDPHFPFSAPAPSTPVNDFAVVAAPVGCLL